MAEQRTKGILLLIDANSIVHRAYHALPPLTGPDGAPTGALYGLASILIKLLKTKAPRYAAAAFDLPEPTLRKQKFKEYKALRPPTPDDLLPQLAAARDLISRFGIKVLDAPGYEADDIIATLTQRFGSKVDQAVVVSGDLDLLQAVKGNQVVAEVPQRGISETVLYDEPGVLGRLGIKPDMVPDYKGLVGDKSDNIPGVPGIGPKTAVNLIQKYGTIEDMYQKIKILKQESPVLAEKLEKNRTAAVLSKELATAFTNAPAPTDLEDLRTTTELCRADLLAHLTRLGFKTLLERVSPESIKPERRMGKLF